MKVHLVDGTYELFRAYFGAPKKTGLSGREVGACAGILRSLLFLLRDEDVTHVACAFDHVIESFRNDLFAGYKTGEGVPEDLLSQFGLAEDVTRALGIVTWPMVEFEADDAIATAAFRFASDPRVEQVVIASPDKDLTQCVTGARVVLWDRRRQIVLDEAGVRAKFGVPRNRFGFSRAGRRRRRRASGSLDGKIGRGGARRLRPRRGHSRERGSLAGQAAARLRPRGRAQHEREKVLLYRKLATLRLDVPLEEDLDALLWRGAVARLSKQSAASSAKRKPSLACRDSNREEPLEVFRGPLERHPLHIMMKASNTSELLASPAPGPP
jgi:5'-3' exonuclease